MRHRFVGYMEQGGVSMHNGIEAAIRGGIVVDSFIERARAHFWNHERDRRTDQYELNVLCDNLCIRSSIRPLPNHDFREFVSDLIGIRHRMGAIERRKFYESARVEYDCSSCRDTFTVTAINRDQMLRLSNGAVVHPLWMRCV